MTILFRVNYSTRPGQSLWVRFTCQTADGTPLERTLPMRWLNADQWQCMAELPGNAACRLDYHYQLRQDSNGVALDEWRAPRVVEIDPARQETIALLDTWCSAGTEDYLFETRAISAALPPRGPFRPAVHPPAANHHFRLRMAAVPAGSAPCLLGGTRELGEWDFSRALPLTETAANTWETAVRLPDEAHAEYKFGLWNHAESRAVSLEQGPNRTLPPHVCGARQLTMISDEGYRRTPQQRFRGAGVAVPVFALRSAASLGVGEFADLEPFADWAASAGLRLIQILPVNDTTSCHDWTDSYPYSAISVFALHPIYLRIDDLPYPMPATFGKELATARAALNPLPAVDHEAVMAAKSRLTRAVYQRHRAAILRDAEFLAYRERESHWLPAYAAFCHLRDRFGTADFTGWGEWAAYQPEKAAALTDPAGADWPDLAYHAWLQFELDRQLTRAVAHLHQRGIALKGDLPIGIDRHSADAWSQPHLFHMEAQAGAPPDAFAAKGQNWGFPTYNWEAMRQDGFAWWQARFASLGRYFDAFRIDHILGFFRIWQIPREQVEGIMGWFDPALPLHIDEIRARGIPFDILRYCRPYLREHTLAERFGDLTGRATDEFLEPCGAGFWKLRDAVATQRQIADRLAPETATDAPDRERAQALRQALFDCASEVLFHEVPGSGETLFHPRCLLRETRSFRDLDPDTRWRMEELHNDYFYHRQEDFWEARGFERLPAMRRASPMLLCGEDLGMVPACVPGVMRELGILSLEIQRMPKDPRTRFFDPAHAPYASVVSPSTHDMATLRGWWREDAHITAEFAQTMLGEDSPLAEITAELAERIIAQHLHSPAMWAVFPLQDLLAIDDRLRHPDPDAERINVPAIMPYYWRYRVHLEIEQLATACGFNHRLAALIRDAGR